MGRRSRPTLRATFEFPSQPGPFKLTVIKDGFAPVTTVVTVAAGQAQGVIVELQPQPTVEEHVTVSATRTGRARRRPGDARRSAGRRGDRGKAAHDARRHRHDAERDGRTAGAGHVAVARSREHPRSGHARALHTLSLGRSAALRRRSRRPRPSADPTDGSRPGGGDQRRRLGALRCGRARRRDRSHLQTPWCRTGPRGAGEPYDARRHRCRAVCGSAAWHGLERNASRRRPLATEERRGRRRLGRSRRVFARGRSPAPVLATTTRAARCLRRQARRGSSARVARCRAASFQRLERRSSSRCRPVDSTVGS